MSYQGHFIAASRKYLSVGRKSLSASLSMGLAAQVSAVDFGLKPALLYDCNSANADQVQQYLTCLQAAQLMSNSLFTLNISGNTLIINPSMVIMNLEQLLIKNNVAVINVCHSLEKPCITSPLSGDLRKMAQDLLFNLKEFLQLPKLVKPLLLGEKIEWNLCTLFGILLGYPATYWFDQNRSFENCLSMTPLMVTKAIATWHVDTVRDQCCIYSFSIPALLQEDTKSTLNHWNVRLKERFNQQVDFSDLTVCQSTVTLPSVCL